jgi:hypothetical protein
MRRARHPARHAARELARNAARGPAQAHGLQLRHHDVAQEALRQACVLAQRKCDVFVHVEIGQQRAILEQHPHAPAHPENLPAR